MGSGTSNQGNPGQTVWLHLYSLNNDSRLATFNAFAATFNTGIFHAGVEVYGQEWSFVEVEGVIKCEPGMCPNFPGLYRGKRKIGVTNMTEQEVDALINAMKNDNEGPWQGQNYETMTKNCCHFSEEFAYRMTNKKISFWVKSWARFLIRIAAVTFKGMDARKKLDDAFVKEEYMFGDFTRGILCMGRNRRGAKINDTYRCGDCTCGLFRFCCVSQDAWDRGFVWNRSRSHRVLDLRLFGIG